MNNTEIVIIEAITIKYYSKGAFLNRFDLMNFMFHTMLDAAFNILRMHCKSMKCDVSFSLGSVSTLFR